MATELARMQQLIGTSADWQADDIILQSGEIGFEVLISGLITGKVGDGVTTYSLLDYTLGAGVDLTTDQTIGGVKTFIDNILIRNQATITDFGQLWSSDFPVGVHALTLDAREIDSVLYLQARDGGGLAQTLTVSGDGTLRWNNTIIADDTGLAGVTWGGFDGTGLATRGSGFTSSNPALGQYDLVFDTAAAAATDQSIAVSGAQLAPTSISVTSAFFSTTEATIWVATAGDVAAVSACTFIRNYIAA
jgi:hypothetical protein